MSRRGLLPLLVLATVLSVGSALADVHPNTAPGLPVEQSFHVGDVDSVNLFNGGLTLTIPIGISYPVNSFSYALKLTYNSNPWDFLTFSRFDPTSQMDVSRTQAVPNRCSNAGLGWRISFGRMSPPCQVPGPFDTPTNRPIYQDENGTDHIFYPTLHTGDAEDAPVGGVSDVEYTRDGSYLRLKVYAGYKEIEYPDGSVRKFDSTTGLPTQLRDRFNNALSIAYPTMLQPFEGASYPAWILTDSVGRTQTIYFRTDLPSYNRTVHAIALAGFAGAPAIYRFNYTTTTIGRGCPHNDSDTPTGVSDAVRVPLLSSVTLPDSSSWTANSYITALPSAPSGPDQYCTESGGSLTALTLPTLGSLNWTWQKVYFPSGSAQRPHLQANPGVATRTMLDPNHSAQNGTWTYTYAPGFPAADTAKEHTTTVVDPLGHRAVNYFSIALDASYTGCSTYDYSLPISCLRTLAGTSLTLSRQTFNTPTDSSPLRSEYVDYERDPVFAVMAPDWYNTNRRPVQNRTVYDDDGIYGGVINSNFDGLGHYRSQQTEGSFPAANVRGHFASFNPAQGTYTVNVTANSGSGYSLFPASSPWVLETPSSMSDTEGGATSQVDFCYVPGTPAVTRKRVHRLDGAATSAQDLVSVYDIVAGNVTAEKSYGGDAPGRGGIGSGDLCALALPASPEFEIDHTYTAGVRVSSKYAGTGFYFLNYPAVDPSSGLPTRSFDTAGLETDYEFDVFGRLLWSKPQGVGQGGWTEYVYTPASGSIKPNALVRRRANGSTSAPVLATSYVVFDGFGRVFQEQKTLPDNSTSKRETAYDGAGNKKSVSEWTTGATTNLTQYFSYDPFGRPGTIQPPDGAAHSVAMTYHGVRQVDRTVKIATAPGTENPAKTTEIYDRQGRLSSVTEPSGTSGANVTTTYGYDVGNRLVSVFTPAGAGGVTVTQTRSFSYDRAGLLQSETHPEKGLNGNGTVTYPIYDSGGHALRKIDGPHDLDFTYDAAERLRLVQEHGSGGRPLKSFNYVDFNSGSDLSQGKLKSAVRNNYVTVNGTVFPVAMTETYTYAGRDGRISQRNTVASTGESFTQGFTYNDLGLVSALSYPLCTHAGCTSPAVFSDVPQGAPYQREIEAIYPGVTSGCISNPLSYCPNANITRGEMAVFLLRAKEGSAYQPPACSQVFTDVPCANNPFAPWINEIYNRGITHGCSTSPLMYCPNDYVDNSVMAVFVIATLSVAVPACPAGPPPFADITCGTFGAASIAEEARRQITTGCGGGNFCPNNLVTRAQMAALLVHAFDIPVKTDAATPRSMQFAYNQGLLTGVSSGALTYGTLSYYPNLLVNQVSHRNGVIETQANDPNEMRRPSSFSATGPYPGWSSGLYAYDGAGNIKTIGSASFTYDTVSRLVASTQYDGPIAGTGTAKQQSYTFDAFGNLTGILGTVGRMTPTAPQTNRLNASGTQYDAAGNLTNWNSAIYQYDAFNQMTTMSSGTEYWAYLYTADDERVWSYDLARGLSHWTVRDLGSKVLRDYLNSGGNWSVATDYIYRDGLLLAAETQTGQRHFHVDQLGTPRLITRAGGEKVAYHLYYPFGEEATAFNQDTERMKFTGHERDLASPGGSGDDLDYMHARHESPVTGRFLSTDSHSGDPRLPQTWNRYAYAFNSPLKLLDRNGKWPTKTHEAIIDRAFPGLSNVARSLLKATSKSVDEPSGQTRAHNHDHAMKSAGEDPRKASAAIDQHIKTLEAGARRDKADGNWFSAMDEFGQALHTAVDRTSPAHTDQRTGAPRDWSGIPLNRDEFQEVQQHEREEAHITDQQMQAAVDAARKAYADTFGDAALTQAVTPPPK